MRGEGGGVYDILCSCGLRIRGLVHYVELFI